jgi:DNA modification methylase
MDGKLISEEVVHLLPSTAWPHEVDNRLILGDNLRVMTALLTEYKGKIDLIYTDPPFFTNKEYPARVGRDEDSRKPEEWRLAEGYGDEWEDLDSYLDMLYPRLQLMHRLLSPSGSLYLHLDWHADSYARILLDEIFGYENHRNEIIWTYHGPSPIRSAYNRKHDLILFYTKSDNYTFNVDQIRVPYASQTVDTFRSSSKAGFGKVPDLERGKVPEDWWYFPVVARLHGERTGYPTQKPEALLERIILASSNPGELVADFFSGSGTTAVVAARQGRGFITSDNQLRALQVTRSRLVLDSQEQPKASPSDTIKPTFMIQRESHYPAQPVLPLEETDLPPAWWHDGLVALPEELHSRAVYWEVDPDFQGDLYHSRYQAARPWRKGDLPAEIAVGERSDNMTIRVLLESGELYQQKIK